MKEDKGTSWVADARKLLQDFVAPEVRAVVARLDASDKLAGERHAALLSSSEERHTAVLDMLSQRDKVSEERHAAMLDMLSQRDKVLEERYTALLDMLSQRDKVSEERHAFLVEKVESGRRELESARREVLLQVELAVAKARLGEQPVSRTEATPPPQ